MTIFLMILLCLGLYILAAGPVLYFGERIRIREYKNCNSCQRGDSYYAVTHSHSTALWGEWGIILALWPFAGVYYLCSEFTDFIIAQAHKEKKPVVLVRKPSRFARMFRTED